MCLLERVWEKWREHLPPTFAFVTPRCRRQKRKRKDSSKHVGLHSLVGGLEVPAAALQSVGASEQVRVSLVSPNFGQLISQLVAVVNSRAGEAEAEAAVVRKTRCSIDSLDPRCELRQTKCQARHGGQRPSPPVVDWYFAAWQHLARQNLRYHDDNGCPRIQSQQTTPFLILLGVPRRSYSCPAYGLLLVRERL